MPLSTPAPRREIHYRAIDMRAFAREDGLYDVEAHLVDRKSMPFQRRASPVPVPAGHPIHDMWVRLTIDAEFVVRAIEASSDVTPYAICKEAESALQVMVGEPIAAGWSSKVKERLKGAASCTHLKELLPPLATTAMQGVRNLMMQMAVNRDTNNNDAWLIDSCYAYGRDREMVKMMWPESRRPK